MIFDLDVQEFIENRIDRMPTSIRFRLIRFAGGGFLSVSLGRVVGVYQMGNAAGVVASRLRPSKWLGWPRWATGATRPEVSPHRPAWG